VLACGTFAGVGGAADAAWDPWRWAPIIWEPSPRPRWLVPAPTTTGADPQAAASAAWTPALPVEPGAEIEFAVVISWGLPSRLRPAGACALRTSGRWPTAWPVHTEALRLAQLAPADEPGRAHRVL